MKTHINGKKSRMEGWVLGYREGERESGYERGIEKERGSSGDSVHTNR